MPEFATWPGAGLGFQIDYSREALENIRRRAIQGLRDRQKISFGVGGILLGQREAHRITILDSFELPCSQTSGPAYLLTPEELARACDLFGNAEASRVIGWYWSRGVRPIELTDSDRTVLAASFPEPWHIGLLVQPHMAQPARIAFLSLDSNGGLLQGEPGALAEWHMEPAEVATSVEPELAPAQAPTTPAPIPIPVTPFVEPVSAPPVNPEPVTRKTEGTEQLGHDPVVTIGARNGSRWDRLEDPFAVLAFDAAQREGSRRKRLTWILAASTVIVTVVIGLILSRFWTPPPPPPPLVLRSSEVDGKLVFRWNNDAVKGIGHAEIFITDGDSGRAISLDRSQLSAGELRYVRESSHVTATMTAGKQEAESFFTGPAPRRKGRSPGRPAAPKGTSKAP